MGARMVPENAFRMGVGAFAISDKNGKDAKSAPVTLTARSGQPIQHWYWGKVVHDLDGMQLHKDRLAIDYCHDPVDVMGYLNKFDIESGDLLASGALVPFKDNDRATEVIFKAGEGVPYEASITFDLGTALVEELAEGQVATVNGYRLEGPATIFRKWNLRGVAVCPYGQDMNTETKFAKGGGEVQVNFAEDKGDDMGKQEKPEVVETPKVEETPVVETPATETEAPAETDEGDAPEPVVDAPAETEEGDAPEPVVDAPAETEEGDAPEPVVDASAETTELSARKALGKKFMDAFGEEKGSVYFAKCMNFEDATAAFNADILTERDNLRVKNAELQAKVTALSVTGEDPASVTETPLEDNADKGSFMQMSKQRQSDKGGSLEDAMKFVAKEHPEVYKAYRVG